jgi:hypothetical protein
VAGGRPPLAPADGEVARILDVPLDELLETSRFATVERVRGEVSMAVPLFRVGPKEADEIWGATAMVLAEFLTLLGWNVP